MDTSEDDLQTAPIVSDSQSSSGLSISIHPLVLLNISDHYTRTKLQEPEFANGGRIYGALLAQQSGRDIDVINSFELPRPNSNGQVDRTYLASKTEQLKQVFPNLDFMGWYSIGTEPTELDLKLHEQFLQVNESAIYLQLDPAGSSKQFPVTIYESSMDMIQEQVRLVFVKSTYKIETNEAERVAVDHVAKPSTTGADSSLTSALVSHLTTQRNAIAMLHSRIQFLHQYLQDTKDGKIPMDHDIIRQIVSVCRRAPLTTSPEFDAQFSTEMNDVLLAAYLTTITKGMNAMNDLVDKFNLAYGATHAAPAGPGAHERSMMTGKASMMSPASGGRRRARMHPSRT